MHLYVLNRDLETIDVIDEYISLIWATRYFTNGDFELYAPVSQKLLNVLQIGNYITRHDCNCTMIIEKIEITTHAENGNVMIVRGKSLESLLGRRIVWGQMVLNDTAEVCMRKLVDANLIHVGESGGTTAIVPYNGILPNRLRVIPEFQLGTLKGFSDKLQTQFTGDIVQSAVEEIAMTFGYGWRVILQNDEFIFDVYKGLDRTYSQTKNPWCVFSPNFGNLTTSDYVKDVTQRKNAALIAGEGEGAGRTKVQIGSCTGVDRCELYVDARDLSRTVNDVTVTEAQYESNLRARGTEKLSETGIIESLSGDVDSSMLNYRTDYNLGDIVQIDNGFGVTGTARITEIIESQSEFEKVIIPTLNTWEVVT